METSPSRTAVMAAVVRGRHQLDDAPPWILEDPLALEFVGPSWRKIAASSDARHTEEMSRQMRAAIAMRSRYAEDRLEDGTFQQYVLLGAGLDSFAWRRPGLLGPLRVFEVDHPASQAWKRERLVELGMSTDVGHVFAPVDFESESLAGGLDAAGFDWSGPTLFSWLGVIPYLTRAAVDSTLATIACCGSGTEVVLEYGLSDAYLDDVSREFVLGFRSIAVTVGEPVRLGWSPAEAEAVIVDAGLGVADHPPRADLVDRYFADRSDGLLPWSIGGLMTAAVP